MIKRIQVEGFKSFKSLDFEMRPLNVLIGPNAGGKTNFVDLFKFIQEMVEENVEEPCVRRGGSQGVLFWGAGADDREAGGVRVGLELTVEGTSDARYEFSFGFPPYPLRKDRLQGTFRGKNLEFENPFRNKGVLMVGRKFPPYEFAPGVGAPWEFPEGFDMQRRFIAGNIYSWWFYRNVDTGERAPIRSPQVARSGIQVFEDGSNLTSVLHNLHESPQGLRAYSRIEEILSQVFPGFRGLTFPAEGGEGRLMLRWIESPFDKKAISAAVLSDGTLRFLYYLAILLCPEPPPLVVIEEPELGLHPEMVRIIASLLKEASDRTQLVVTTHSPELVSAVEPQDVVVVEKQDGETKMTRLSSREDLASWLKDFTLGELWRMGEIGGTP